MYPKDVEPDARVKESRLADGLVSAVAELWLQALKNAGQACISRTLLCESAALPVLRSGLAKQIKRCIELGYERQRSALAVWFPRRLGPTLTAVIRSGRLCSPEMRSTLHSAA